MSQYLIIKCGGSVFETLPPTFYQNIVQLAKAGLYIPVVVHGGGPLISTLLGKLEIKTEFVNGLRVTTDEVLDVVEMVLSGSVNKAIVRRLTEAGGQAFGMSGIDGGLLQSEPIDPNKTLGHVGKVVSVNTEVIGQIAALGYIPVISPLGIDTKGQRYNINGDSAASAVAQALGAKLCLVSDISGIYIEVNGQKVIQPELTTTQIVQLISDGVITGGMIPKVQAAIDALSHVVPEVVIFNGMEAGSLLRFASGEAVGTTIRHKNAQNKERSNDV